MQLAYSIKANRKNRLLLSFDYAKIRHYSDRQFIMTEQISPRADGYLVLSNISKNHNIGNMVRSACAFGMKEVGLFLFDYFR